MIVLLDTSTPVCKLTLVNDDWRYENEWQADRELARGLLAYLQDQLQENGRSLHDLSGVGVFKGPGSFTGLRIGLTVLNTLADTEGIPIIGATGDDWQEEVLERLGRGENDKIVLPLYGSQAHITKPRK